MSNHTNINLSTANSDITRIVCTNTKKRGVYDILNKGYKTHKCKFCGIRFPLEYNK